MAVMIVVAILLTINMCLMHADKLISIYRSAYKKLIKPKFKEGEFVMIDNIEYEVIYIMKLEKPYTYYCLPVDKTVRHFCSYFHEKVIDKKVGVLKELE